MASKASEPKKEVRVPVSSDNDLVTARREGRFMAEQLGLSSSEATLVATAISELARNIVSYARNGEIHICLINNGVRRGITIVARDEGPGIADTKLAVQAGYSTSGGLGLGLPGVRRIMDEFEINSEPGRGTTITITKWTRR
ncbi:MAG TPA: anti-sigma regulatory factor [Burkholderiales bacterium]|jgi:serine/threonine-protein kinase RsbT